MIAHRLAAVQDADVILVMHKGSIVEYGSHSQLMEMNGMYAAMYREQEGRSHA
jgi:ATP-binding cassette subfamily B protein